MLLAVHVLEREQVFVLNECVPFGILQREGQAAELGTLATIGGSTKAILRSIAPAAVGDAERTVNEDFKPHFRNRIVDVAYLFK